ncbi:MAG: glycosyltransferase [Oscillospiraceae bacterium]|nr:glycosyltransferase [Oscillospiraceae bacterium]
MLDELYKLSTPWAKANKWQILVNRLTGVLANIVYPIYCKIKPLHIPEESRNPYIIVSLTTFPARVDKVSLCMNSILRQKKSPDMVVLWLAKTQFPNKNELPLELRNLESHGLTIRYCDDLRSYKKVFYTAQEFPDSVIITADDDTLYPESWLQGLIEEHKRYQDCVICYRAHKIVIDDGKVAPYDKWYSQSPGIKGPDKMLVPIGVGGVLYPAGFFSGVNFDIETIRRLCPTADDLWLKAIGLKKGYSVVKVNSYSKEWFTIKDSQKASLMQTNVCQNQNDVAMDNLSHYYQIDWKCMSLEGEK